MAGKLDQIIVIDVESTYWEDQQPEDSYQRAIRHHFALPSATPFLTDIHSTTTPEDLERLFDDLS